MDNPVYNTPKEAVASSISNFEIEPINIRIPTPENIKIKLIRKMSHKTVIITMLKLTISYFSNIIIINRLHMFHISV